jgi:hypothetical protein
MPFLFPEELTMSDISHLPSRQSLPLNHVSRLASHSSPRRRLLQGLESIREFIACIAHAMLINAIDNDDASKLLYAAQVALSAARTQPAPARPGSA